MDDLIDVRRIRGVIKAGTGECDGARAAGP